MPIGRWRSPLGLLQLGSIVVPAALLVAWGILSWNWEHDRAFDRAEAEVQLLREYALRVIETQQSLLIEADRLTAGINVSETEQIVLHERLLPLIGRLRFTLGVGIIAPDGEIVASTTYPIAGRADHRAYFKALRDNPGEDIFIERVTLEPGAQEALLVARRRSGAGFVGALVAAVDVDAVTEFLARLANVAGSSAALVATDGTLLLRYPSPPPGAVEIDGSLRRAVGLNPSGTYEAPASFDDVARLYAFSRLDTLPVVAKIGVAKRAVFDAWLHSFVLLGAILAALAAAGFAISTLAIRRVVAERQRQQLAFERHRLEDAQRAAATKDALLREAHHRTKNNLQMILAMVQSKARDTENRESFRDVETRLLALAQVHDLLHTATSDGSSIDLGEFLESLCNNPSILPPERGIPITCEVESIDLEIEQAIPVALIVVEIVTNSLKHAFPNNRTGRINVTLARLGDAAVVTVGDDGIGLPRGEARERSSGLRLIKGLARQLNASLDIITEQGTQFHLKLPIERPVNQRPQTGVS